MKKSKSIKDAYYFNNRHYTEDEVIQAFSPYADSITIDAESLESETGSIIEKYDNISITDYLIGKGINGWLLDFFDICIYC